MACLLAHTSWIFWMIGGHGSSQTIAPTGIRPASPVAAFRLRPGFCFSMPKIYRQQGALCWW